MSSTRKSVDPSVFRQERYASSPEFERGLMANLVAKRCSLLELPADRELIWFIQYRSHQPGALASLKDDLLQRYCGRLQTPAMAASRIKLGKICGPELVRKIRSEMAWEDAAQFPLKGDEGGWDHDIESLVEDAEQSRRRHRAFDASLPSSYPLEEFSARCRNAAGAQLENYLRELCLDPKSSLTAGPWYFPALIDSLREYLASYVSAKTLGCVTTALGQKVGEVLGYTAYCRGLTLMQGGARLGKSFAARRWCEQHPGVARFVEVPPSNDDASFFRALARGLGLGNLLQYKVGDLRERVESVLLTGHLLLVLDEAHRLWPQRNQRYAFPVRINWIMAMANHGVPICGVSTPQFIEWQKAAEEKGRWNSAQLTGRISHFESLPVELSAEDLMAVAQSVLPEASHQVLRALALYAQSSARYLAAIDSISKRARFIAMRDGREQATTSDVRRAMKESVIPADAKLQQALESGRKNRNLKPLPEPVIPAADDFSPRAVPSARTEPVDLQVPRSRLTAPAPDSRNRAGNETSLIEA